MSKGPLRLAPRSLFKGDWLMIVFLNNILELTPLVVAQRAAVPLLTGSIGAGRYGTVKGAFAAP